MWLGSEIGSCRVIPAEAYPDLAPCAPQVPAEFSSRKGQRGRGRSLAQLPRSSMVDPMRG
jgi:hypothetical protein